MPQVNALGTGGTFTTDAKKFGLDATETAEAARSWFTAKVGATEKTYYPFEQGTASYKVELTYNTKTYHLTCNRIEKT